MLNEGTEVYLSFKGIRIAERVYELITSPEFDKNDMTPEFEVGDLVQCEFLKHSEGQFWTAYELM